MQPSLLKFPSGGRATGHAAEITWDFFRKSIWAYEPFRKVWAGYPKKNVRDIGKMLCPSRPTNQSVVWKGSPSFRSRTREASQDERGNISNNHDPRPVASLWCLSAGSRNSLKFPIRATWRHFPPQPVAMLLNLSHAKCHME